jgi:PPK2 family polyphosphate:nucleotide phosphotransferase
MLCEKFDNPGKVSFTTIPTKSDGGMTEAEALARFAKQAIELERLQELLSAAGTHALLVVLQGRDASGKDGAIKSVAGAMNPGGTRVAAFKVPTPEERAHDFLWRIHKQTPGKGEVVFFNRSHYEDILVVRVHNLAPKEVWEKRYDDINNFENLLTDNNVIVVKFFLHVSKDEQERRLLDREANSEKSWKLNPSDWTERSFWDDYSAAYDDVLERCSMQNAPWYVIPGDNKWFRNVAMAEVLIEALKPYKAEWKASLAKLGAEQKIALEKIRAASTA